MAWAVMAIMKMPKSGPYGLNRDEWNTRGIMRFVIVPPRMDSETPRNT